MPNDAKLGLAVGVGLVIAFAVVSYRTESSTVTVDPAATIIQPEQTDTPRPSLRNNRRTPTTSTARAGGDVPVETVSRQRPVEVVLPKTNDVP